MMTDTIVLDADTHAYNNSERTAFLTKMRELLNPVEAVDTTDDLPRKLSHFLTRMSELLAKTQSTSGEETPEVTLSAQDVQVFFDKLKPAIAEYEEVLADLKRQGLMANVWKATGLKQDEVRNSSVLKWFLDCYADHGQGNLFLTHFLRMLPEPFDRFIPNNYRTYVESNYVDDVTNRIDIVIDAAEFLLFIEVKINSNEGKDQLLRYLNTAKNNTRGRAYKVVYLTRNGKLPEKVGEFYSKDIPNLCGLSWKSVADKFKNAAKELDEQHLMYTLTTSFAKQIEVL